ncbi:MAG: acyl carrier protein [Ruminococcaceae bacterium]|nr:acyl carrier protein [Oscillospiraceae bacterium]
MIQEIIEIIAKQLKVDVDSITPDTDIIDDLGADSLDIVELLMTIEDKYGISVPDDEVTNLRTIALMGEYIETHNN